MQNHEMKMMQEKLNNSELCRVLRLVLSQLEEQREAVSFAAAVQALLRARAGRRPRTLGEISSVCRRLMRREPGLGERSVQDMPRRYCAQLLEMHASTPRQRAKMRIILHGLFEYCVQQEWCVFNPIALLPAPEVSEQELVPLSWAELSRLMRIARLPEHAACLPALGLLLWAGVRPAELERLYWDSIDWEENVIILPARHSKTGGCRHIQLQPVLRRILRRAHCTSGRICPPNWQRRWRRLRDAAGLIPWRQDVLRHTFASYHAKQFHDFARLQEDMGHRSAALLRTRYLSMRGITAAQAARFWKPGAL